MWSYGIIFFSVERHLMFSPHNLTIIFPFGDKGKWYTQDQCGSWRIIYHSDQGEHLLHRRKEYNFLYLHLLSSIWISSQKFLYYNLYYKYLLLWPFTLYESMLFYNMVHKVPFIIARETSAGDINIINTEIPPCDVGLMVHFHYIDDK